MTTESSAPTWSQCLGAEGRREAFNQSLQGTNPLPWMRTDLGRCQQWRSLEVMKPRQARRWSRAAFLQCHPWTVNTVLCFLFLWDTTWLWKLIYWKKSVPKCQSRATENSLNKYLLFPICINPSVVSKFQKLWKPSGIRPCPSIPKGLSIRIRCGYFRTQFHEIPFKNLR